MQLSEYFDQWKTRADQPYLKDWHFERDVGRQPDVVISQTHPNRELTWFSHLLTLSLINDHSRISLSDTLVDHWTGIDSSLCM